tara:strand:- start:3624 stop:4634 length:1011 start_codon:yes stop_codon:yes gene_type:complete
MSVTPNKNYISLEELHIRHLNLLIDLKNYQFNNWFYRMAIINTFDDLKVLLRNLERNKYKCIIAIENKKIIGYVSTFPTNNKKSCLKINTPTIIGNNINFSRRELILKLIKTSINNNNLNTSNWIINSDINDTELISCSRELGFQPLQEVNLWNLTNININRNSKPIKLNNYEQISPSNIKRFLNFIRSNENIIIRNMLDLDYKDIKKRKDNNCGIFLNNDEIIFGILRETSYENENIYSLIRGPLWNNDFNDSLYKIIHNLILKDNSIVIKTYEHDSVLNSNLSNLKLVVNKKEMILVRNTYVKKDLKTSKLNKSFDTFLQRINPQGNIYPSPMP